MKNIYEEIPPRSKDEFLEVVTAGKGVRIERIVSEGHQSPEEFWYDQEESEFVVVLKGQGCIEFESGKKVQLKPGDWLNIDAHERHRVAWTSEMEQTVWLAVFYSV